MADFVKLHDDGPAINVDRSEQASDMKAYFDESVACGDLYAETSTQEQLGLLGSAWKKPSGCGARDWEVAPIFWYPRPGRQFKLTCNRCKQTFAVEVRTPIKDTPSDA